MPPLQLNKPLPVIEPQDSLDPDKTSPESKQATTSDEKLTSSSQPNTGVGSLQSSKPPSREMSPTPPTLAHASSEIILPLSATPKLLGSPIDQPTSEKLTPVTQTSGITPNWDAAALRIITFLSSRINPNVVIGQSSDI